jgi:CBS domain containing-hemolysin-like protein
MIRIKRFIILLYFVFLIKCEEESISINAKFFPKSNEIIYNGNIYILSSNKKFQKNEIIEDKIDKIPGIRFLQETGRSRPFSGAFWFNLIVFITLACFAGTMSGLTVGYLSIDSLILEIKMGNGTENEKYYAEKIFKLVDNHHWLLVTLLLCNSFACEAMPIFLSKLVNEMMAVILSVTVLLFVGEIIPQALCTGPNQMKIASILAPFTYFLMIITYPISYPIAKFMDYVIGVQGKSRFCNSDLKSIIELHVKEIVGDLSGQQLGYFTGFLDIMKKKVGELILPIEKTLKLDYHSKITKITLKRLIDSGYSRIPIYEHYSNNLIGILRMKELVGKDMSKNYTLSQLGINLSHPIHAYEDTLFLDLFEKFKGGKSHMAFIHQKEDQSNAFNSISFALEPNEKVYEKNIPTSPIKGIITLEDLIEFWLKIPILDEEDYIHDQDRNRKRPPHRRKTFLDIISTKNFNVKLYKLFDSKSPINPPRKNDDNSLNDNSYVINNYHPLNDKNDDKNDDENEKLIFK